MASYTDLGENKYKIFVELGYNDKGKRIRKTKTVTAKSPRALKKAITDFEIELANSNNSYDVEKITFKAFVEHWFKMYVDTDLTIKTKDNYKYLAGSHMMSQLGDLKMNKIKTMHIVQYFNQEKIEGRRSLLQKYVCLKSIFSKAVKWDVIAENPMDGVDRPKSSVKKREGKLFCYDEFMLNKMLTALSSEKKRLQMQVKLACLVGLRRSEITGLRISSLNFTNNTIFIDKTMVWNKYDKTFQFGKTKNKHPRTVYVPEGLMKELKEYSKRQKEYKMAYGFQWKGMMHEGESVDLLFTTATGGPMFSEYVNIQWGKFLKRHNLPQLNFHGLRHTYASVLVNRNENFKVIQEQLGHENINETIKTYSHLTEERKSQSASIFNEFL